MSKRCCCPPQGRCNRGNYGYGSYYGAGNGVLPVVILGFFLLGNRRRNRNCNSNGGFGDFF